ncbi:MAG: LPS export ABC transporter periplasmic protein LptC [Parvibaculum sp.]|nr:LPS export ABC transporter periplasmic protein LptC [Parvibaculum sp.]
MTGPKDLTHPASHSPSDHHIAMAEGLYAGHDTSATPAGASARIGRHSHFVSAMKVALPLTAIALFVTVLFYSGLFAERDRLDITFKEISSLNSDLRMVSPRITGLDRSGEPYLLTADTATQGKDKPTQITLDNVEADLKLSDDDSWVSLKSTSGLLDTETEQLTLNQTIDVYMSTGYEFHGTQGSIDFRQGTFTSTSAVEGHGPAGTLRADSMVADNEAQKLTFKGRVKMKFYGKE